MDRMDLPWARYWYATNALRMRRGLAMGMPRVCHGRAMDAPWKCLVPRIYYVSESHSAVYVPRICYYVCSMRTPRMRYAYIMGAPCSCRGHAMNGNAMGTPWEMCRGRATICGGAYVSATHLLRVFHVYATHVPRTCQVRGACTVRMPWNMPLVCHGTAVGAPWARYRGMQRVRYVYAMCAQWVCCWGAHGCAADVPRGRATILRMRHTPHTGQT